MTLYIYIVRQSFFLFLSPSLSLCLCLCLSVCLSLSLIHSGKTYFLLSLQMQVLMYKLYVTIYIYIVRQSLFLFLSLSLSHRYSQAKHAFFFLSKFESWCINMSLSIWFSPKCRRDAQCCFSSDVSLYPNPYAIVTYKIEPSNIPFSQFNYESHVK